MNMQMKEVIHFLDENNKVSLQVQSDPHSDEQLECNDSDKCCENKKTNSENEKARLTEFLKNTNNTFDNSNMGYGYNYKEMLKYSREKYDPNYFNDVHLIARPTHNHNKNIYNPLKNPRINGCPVKKEIIEINVDINNIDDLLKVIKDNPLSETKEYNINMDSLHKIEPYLKRLNDMIGMKDLKQSILDQILYFIQDLHKATNHGVVGDFMHTVIYGPPGTGKTEVAKIIGKIFCKLNVLKKGTFKKATRTDLVAGYLGQTATKTNDLIKECLGGVLFIDEAYALGNSEKRDSFAKECIDTLCEGLSNHKDNLMVIIAGYESELKDCFFAYNQGLESRFNWRFKTGQYNGSELYEIFIKKVEKIGWTVDPSIDAKWFERNAVYFKFYGRDIETVLAKAKIAHGRRIFGKSSENKKKLDKKDLEKGFENFLKIDDVKNRKEDADHSNRMSMLYL
jgi:SpoVK/Ycf46/Vps4 family AAA+-type ATPase